MSPSTKHFDTIRSSLIGMMAVHEKYVRPVGTGVLFQIAGEKFLATAKHVAKESEHSGSLGCTGDNNRGVSLEGVMKVSDDLTDLAVHQLSSSAVQSLKSKTFIQLADFRLTDPPKFESHSILGLPQVWGKGAHVPEKGEIGEIALIGNRFAGEVPALNNFDESRHFLIEVDHEHLTLETGEPWSFKTRDGHPLNFPADLKGISGSPVWLFRGKDGGVPLLTGIQVSIYSKPPFIKVTKASVLLEFIRANFVELRPAIDLIRPK